MKFGIFTKPIHVEKIVNYLNSVGISDYIISTNKREIDSYEFEIGVSYCFQSIIDIGDKMWYNYHPAPLPKYPGLSNYSAPIKDKIRHFGVTLHIMTGDIDKGPIIKKKMFPLESIPINSNELGNITHYYLFQLFKETIGVLHKRPLSEEELDEYNTDI